MSQFKKIPSLLSIQATHYAAQKLARQAAAPIRVEFMGDAKGGQPVARLLRGGRGGEIRLKLFLSILWLAPRSPRHELSFRSTFWAELLDLAQPAGAGARRIGDAISWLEREGFVSAVRRTGYAPQLTLLDERGNREKYRHPPGHYLKLPSEFWTRRWIHDMSGAGLAIFLVSLAELYRHGPKLEFWLAPRVARETYGLSSDTWTKGARELARLGLISVGRAKLRREHVDVLMKRNTYRLAVPGNPPSSLDWESLYEATRLTLSSRQEPIANPQAP